MEPVTFGDPNELIYYNGNPCTRVGAVIDMRKNSVPEEAIRQYMEGAQVFAGGKGNPEALRDWYESGEGADQIRWGEEGDFMRCVGLASKYMSDEQAKGFCNMRHQGATGAPPGHAPGEKKDKANFGTEAGGRWITTHSGRHIFLPDTVPDTPDPDGGKKSSMVLNKNWREDPKFKLKPDSIPKSADEIESKATELANIAPKLPLPLEIGAAATAAWNHWDDDLKKTYGPEMTKWIQKAALVGHTIDTVGDIASGVGAAHAWWTGPATGGAGFLAAGIMWALGSVASKAAGIAVSTTAIAPLVIGARMMRSMNKKSAEFAHLDLSNLQEIAAREWNKFMDKWAETSKKFDPAK